MISQINPHAFVVFLTLSMGMGYAIFNSRGRYGFWKIALFALFIVPFMYQVFVGGHPIELGIGLFIGWLYARGGISLPRFRLPNAFHSLFRSQPKETNQSDSQQRYSNQRGSSQSSYDEKVRQRQEEAKKRREKSKKDKADDSTSQDQKQNQEKSSKQKSNQQKPPPETQKPKADARTSYEILGVSPGASKDEIKKAYRRACNRYASDRHRHMSDEYIKESDEEMKKINEAYKKLK